MSKSISRIPYQVTSPTPFTRTRERERLKRGETVFSFFFSCFLCFIGFSPPFPPTPVSFVRRRHAWWYEGREEAQAKRESGRRKRRRQFPRKFFSFFFFWRLRDWSSWVGLIEANDVLSATLLQFGGRQTAPLGVSMARAARPYKHCKLKWMGNFSAAVMGQRHARNSH